jgi:hypothetical protein
LDQPVADQQANAGLARCAARSARVRADGSADAEQASQPGSQVYEVGGWAGGGDGDACEGW